MSLAGLTWGLFGCNAQPKEFKSVDAQEFKEAIEDKDIVLLDVRTPEEFAEGHIEGAVNINVSDSSFTRNALSTISKSKRVALYCRSGRRSKTAAKILASNGYTVIELNPGYLGWMEYIK